MDNGYTLLGFHLMSLHCGDVRGRKLCGKLHKTELDSQQQRGKEKGAIILLSPPMTFFTADLKKKEDVISPT